MVPDLTLEVIYYNQTTDFKMEFDLCGCCNLRFLSMSAKSKNEFLSALSKSVARSRAIVTVGSFNPLDNEYLPKIIAKAAGYNLTPVEKSELEIVGMGEYTLPETAIPLVTVDGVLGGAVLENSDQTIIMLTKDKDIRHSLLSDLVCPYITLFATKKLGTTSDISTEDKGDSEQANSSAQNTNGDFVTEQSTPEILENKTDIQKISVDQENLDEIDKILLGVGVNLSNDAKDQDLNDGELTTQTLPVQKEEEEQTNKLEEDAEQEETEYTVLEKPEDISNRYSTLEQFLADSEEEFDNPPRPKNRKILKIVISVILVIVVLLAAYFGYEWYFQPMQTTTVNYNAKALYGQAWDGLPQNMLYKFGKLYQTNKDVFGWLNLPNTSINFPVVTSANRSELYYETHLFDGSVNRFGTLYTDSVSDPESYTRNITIYGKDIKKWGALSDIKKYLDIEHYKEAPTFSFDTLYLENKWKVFSVFEFDNAKTNQVIKTTFFDDTDFEGYLQQLKKASAIKTDIEIDADDQLISLVCVGSKSSTAVVARRVRDEESPLVDVTGSNQSDLQYVSDIPENSSDLAVMTPSVFQEISSEISSATSSKKDKVSSKNEPSSKYEQQEPTSSKVVVKPNSSKPNSSKPQSSSKPVSSSSKVSSTTPSSSSSKPLSSSSGANTSSEASSNNTSSKEENTPAHKLPTLTVKNSFNGQKVSGPATVIIAQILEAEMSSGYHIEALKAQAVAAYSWLLCNGSADGKYPTAPMKTAGQNALKAAEAVAGKVAVYKGEVAQTYYYATSAGKTAKSSDIWSAQIPYLVSVDSSVDKNASKFQTINSYSSKDIADRAKELLGIDLNKIKDKTKWFKCTYDENNLYVRTVTIGDSVQKGPYLRNVFFTGKFTPLRSSAYKISYNKEDDKFVFTVRGYGHGVGMSQTGANAYAKNGKSYEWILKHYYKGISLGTYFVD